MSVTYCLKCFVFFSPAANQLVFYYPKIYDFYFPTAALNQFPGLKNLSKNYRKTDPPFSSVQFLNSLGGMQFTSFAKVSKFGRGLSAGSLFLSLFTSHVVRVCNDLNPYNNSNKRASGGVVSTLVSNAGKPGARIFSLV
jgi:hypothetical protein